jgi:hypothetical protein
VAFPGKIGLCVARHPAAYLFLTIWISLVCCIGFLSFESRNSLLDLWVAPDSPVHAELEFNELHFSSTLGGQEITILSGKNLDPEGEDPENILTPKNVQELFVQFTEITSKQSQVYYFEPSTNKSWVYNDICSRPSLPPALSGIILAAGLKGAHFLPSLSHPSPN